MPEAAAPGAGENRDGIAVAERLTRSLEAAFRKIEQERMRDIPILNKALSAACIGMRPSANGWLCVLVTPWFINLLLLPPSEAHAEAWSEIPPGTKLMHQFPAGAFEFICATDNDIGAYRMCSLFSPVLEFENQETAVATAEASLSALFDANLNPTNEGAGKQVPAGEKPHAQKLSRRDLMLGLSKSGDART
ncbi:MAG: [NiFe]-hydrogenase assembly chaperone HybE [Rhodomicrobium sp.]